MDLSGNNEEKLVRKKLADQVLDRLLALIERGELPPGSRLPGERALMERFGVGRPAVREALQTLERMGLIEIQHGERARVVQLDAGGVLRSMDATIRHLLTTSPEMREALRDARLAFEQFLVREAARRATKEGIEQLQQALQAQEAARGDAVRFMTADIRFHVTLASLTGNPLYPALSEAMLGWIFGHYPRLLHAPNVEDLTLKEHAAILKAVEKRDPEAAVRAMKRHLSRAHPRYQRALSEVPS
ncbi:MAG: transcriptional regulator NanR [Bryobacteraceae bacterium]|jgi:DNA-binding FadR family transcriptional regulator